MPTLTRDQQQIAGRNNTGPVLYLSGDYWVASNFTPSVTGNLNKLYLVIHKIGTPGGPLVVSIYATDINGKPTGSALATESIAVGNITDYGLLTVTFSSPASLTASTKYAIVLSNNDGKGGSPDTSNYYKPYWTASGEDFYGSGITDYSSSDGGSTWSSNSTSDLVFITEMSMTPTTPGIDQFCFCEPTSGEFVNSNTTQIAQTFVPSVTAQLKKLKVHLYRIDGQTGGNVTFAITAVDGANKPTGSDLASESVADTSIGSGVGSSPLTVTFTTPATLTSGTTYAIVIRFPNAAGGARYQLGCWVQSDLYSSGREWKSTDSGSTWGNGTYGASADVGFITYMFEPTTTTQTINSAALIKATTTQTSDSDATVQTTSTEPVNSDAKVVLVQNRTLPSSADIQRTFSNNISGGAQIQVPGQEVTYSDATVIATAIKTLLADADILVTSTQTIDATADIESETTRFVMSEAQIKVTQTQNINGTGTIEATIVRQINAAARIAIEVTETIDCDACIVINEPLLKLYVVV